MSDLAFVLERHYRADPERVWAHFTDPALMASWICPNPTLETRCDLDVRPGGAWRCAMGPHVVSGTFVKVEPPRVLAFTWAWQGDGADPATTVRVTITPDGDGSRLLLEHAETAPVDPGEGHQDGWELSLARLEEALAR